MNKHIVLISPHEAMIDCARVHNLKVTVVDEAKNRSKYSNNYEMSFLFFAYHDFELSKNILSAINDICKIDAVITLTEKALPVAAKLALFLKLQALPDEVINLIHNKNAMRAFLADKKDFRVNFLQPKNIDELKEFAKNNGFPFVIKPVDGYGSQGVKKINAFYDIDNIEFSDNLIAEDFIVGDEYSVESFSFSGEHRIIAITKKILIDGDNFTEMGHCVPAHLTDEVRGDIIQYVSDFLTAIGVDNGPSHTEIKLSAGKISIIETHNRIGGDRISSLVKISTGIDLVELSLLWPVGMCQPISKNIDNHYCAAIRFFNPPCGKLVSIAGYESIKYSPSVIDFDISCNPGDSITPILNSFDRYGFVIAIGANENEAMDNAVKATSAIQFTVMPLTD